MSLTHWGNSAGTWEKADGEDVLQLNHAFLIHSPMSLAQNVAPRVDSTMTTRQKRRRTSPEDHAVLEAAFQKNAKPDKAERTAIMKKVALGEKEVQIWFQNRRQNTRRKSRPLLPHEMVPHFRNSIPQELLPASTPTSHDHDYTPSASFSSAEDGVRVGSSSSERSNDGNRSVSRAPSIHDLLNPVSSFESTRSASFESHHHDDASVQTRRSRAEVGRAESFDTSGDGRGKPTPSPYFTKLESDNNTEKRANIGGERVFSKISDSAAALKSIEKTVGAPAADLSFQRLTPTDRQVARPKRGIDEIEGGGAQSSQSSVIRLSMTVDGAVKVRTNEQDTPSPPKERPQNPAILLAEGPRRSHSSIAIREERKESQKNAAKQSSGIFGRSRDARTWEFYCDGDARAALSAQAENENNGSAVSAINLIRSRSDNAKFKAQRKENDRALKPKIGPGSAGKPAALGQQRSKMLPAVSSGARVSGNCKIGSAERQRIVIKPHARSPSGDSDKENRAPATRSLSHPPRQMQPWTRASHNILQDHLPGASHRTVHMRRVQEGNEHAGRDPENALKNDGQEAGSFTHGEDREEDLDCIQGLLSLSQGAWR